MEKKNKILGASANDLYTDFSIAEVYHKYLPKIYLSEGVLEIATEEKCFWFIDLIKGNQKNLKKVPYQKWDLIKISTNQFKVTASDETNRVLVDHQVDDKDFFFGSLTFIKKLDKILLPCEM